MVFTPPFILVFITNLEKLMHVGHIFEFSLLKNSKLIPTYKKQIRKAYLI